MMNRQQFLLTKLAEEAAEIAQIALKTAQFGFNQTKPGQLETNAERCHAEINDLRAIIEMLNEECGFDYVDGYISQQARELKKIRVDTFYNYSKNLGLVK